jgi:hypothetical protein
MRPRHAAALSLVGWYLMVPPMALDGRPDTAAALPKWTLLHSYDTASDCEKAYRKWMTDRKRSSVKELLAQLAGCYATDDPRLKPK